MFLRVTSLDPQSITDPASDAYDLFGNGSTALRGGWGSITDITETLSATGNPPISYSPILYYGNLSTYAQGGGVIGPSNIGNTIFGRQKLPNIREHSIPGGTAR